MGGRVLKNWKPKAVVHFLLSQGFDQIKRKKKGDHVCLRHPKTGAYTEVDLGKSAFSAREMLTFAKQTKIPRQKWLSGN